MSVMMCGLRVPFKKNFRCSAVFYILEIYVKYV